MKIGAIAVGVSLAVVGGVYLYKSGKMDSLVNLGKKYLQKNKKEFDSFKSDTFEFDSFKPDTFDFKTEYKNFQANKHIPGTSSAQRTVVNRTPVERAVVKRTPIGRTSVKQSPMDLSKYRWVEAKQIDSAGKASTIRVPAAEDMDRYARDWAKYMSSNYSDWSYDYAYNYINKIMKKTEPVNIKNYANYYKSGKMV